MINKTWRGGPMGRRVEGRTGTAGGGRAIGPRTPRDARAGFNLVWTALAFTVGATLFAAALPATRSDIRKAGDTVRKLSRVEQKLTGFMAAHGRLPCPADGQYAVDAANFGVEAANPGTCKSGTPAAPLGPD